MSEIRLTTLPSSPGLDDFTPTSRIRESDSYRQEQGPFNDELRRSTSNRRSDHDPEAKLRDQPRENDSSSDDGFISKSDGQVHSRQDSASDNADKNGERGEAEGDAPTDSSKPPRENEKPTDEEAPPIDDSPQPLTSAGEALPDLPSDPQGNEQATKSLADKPLHEVSLDGGGSDEQAAGQSAKPENAAESLADSKLEALDRQRDGDPGQKAKSAPEATASRVAMDQTALPTGEGDSRKKSAAKSVTAETQPKDNANFGEQDIAKSSVQSIVDDGLSAENQENLIPEEANSSRDERGSSRDKPQHFDLNAPGDRAARNATKTASLQNAPPTGQEAPPTPGASLPAGEAAAQAAETLPRNQVNTEGAQTTGLESRGSEGGGEGRISSNGGLQGQAASDVRHDSVTANRDLQNASRVDPARFLQRVARAFQEIPEGGGQLRLRLRPPELGHLRLDVQLRDGVMFARLEAETLAAQQMLTDHLPALRERLAAQDVRVEQFEIVLRDQPEGNFAEHQEGREDSPQHTHPGVRRVAFGKKLVDHSAEASSTPKKISTPEELRHVNVVV